jgi:hypothetical protein
MIGIFEEIYKEKMDDRRRAIGSFVTDFSASSFDSAWDEEQEGILVCLG